MGFSVTRLENSLMNSGLMKKLTAPSASTAAATIALVSNLTKDAFNCYYYVTQSLHNERIPEDKRKFVAGLDLSNGILNVVTQTLLGSQVMKWSDKLFDKFVAPKYYGENAVKNLAEKIKNNSIEAIKDTVNLNKGIAKVGLSVISTLVATQIICKRIIVPLFATPMGSYFKKQFEKNDPKCRHHQHHHHPHEQAAQNNNDRDVISFENNNVCNNKENLPKCFKSFMK